MLNNVKSEKSSDNVVQKQVAGEQSTQVQVGTVVVQGITEERVRAVFKEMISQAIEIYTKEAHEIANERINKLEQEVIPRIMACEDAIRMFADPSFQVLIRKAQQAAAVTEREDDYKLLSELIICRVQKGENRKNRTGIAKAVEIVGDIDNDALCALTIAHALTSYIPAIGNIKQGLGILDGLFFKLMYMELPTTGEWIEHLDVLSAVRINHITQLRRIKAIYTETLSGYVCVGLKIDSDDHKKAIEILQSVNLSEDILVPNELMDGYVRLEIPYKKAIGYMTVLSGGVIREITKEEISALEEIWELYLNDDVLKKKASENFMELWDSFSNLKQIRVWWEAIPISFNVTKVGSVLAHTNAKRCDSHVPDLL